MTRRSRWRVVFGAFAVVVVLVAAALLRPVNTAGLVASPDPARSYSDAESRLREMQAVEVDSINPVCRTRLLTHGAATTHVAVFIHGYTSCPEQFVELGTTLHARGWNVLIPRMPRHGLADRMNTSHSALDAAELVSYADHSIDIAAGLGDSVIVAGISAGGLLAAWAAQNRTEVERAVLIAPLFGYAVVPPSLTLPAMNLFAMLPEAYDWWDDTLMEAVDPDYAYPRYSRKALVQLLRLSLALGRQARREAPQAPRIVMLTSEGDDMISRKMIARQVAAWRGDQGHVVASYEVPRDLGLGHDVITRSVPEPATDSVYRAIVRLMLTGRPTPSPNGPGGD